MSDELSETIRAAIGNAIEAAVGQHEHGFVIKWVALVESVDADGERGLWATTSPEIKSWDVVGLLQHALHLQQAQTLSDRDDE